MIKNKIMQECYCDWCNEKIDERGKYEEVRIKTLFNHKYKPNTSIIKHYHSDCYEEMSQKPKIERVYICPFCGKDNVSVAYNYDTNDGYTLDFECYNCGKRIISNC